MNAADSLPPPPPSGRALRRERLERRQTVIIGSIIAVLLVVGLIALTVATGLLRLPAEIAFAGKNEPVSTSSVPCPPAGAKPLAWNQIKVNVYNGTERTGLAKQVAEPLSALGVKVGNTANNPAGPFKGTVEVVTGPDSVAGAYTLAAVFPGSAIRLDGRQHDVIDVVLGADYTQMLPAGQIENLDRNAVFSAPAGCRVLDNPGS